MFSDKRYITTGIKYNIPHPLQQIMWDLIDSLNEDGKELDYLQVFEFDDIDYIREKALLIHRQEQPSYEQKYVINIPKHILKKLKDKKIFVIDDKEYCTMLFSHEY